jgi:NAD-dependent DNA ligase
MGFYNHDDNRVMAFTGGRRLARSSDEMIGMIHGVLADGHLADQEIRYLASFLVANQEFVAEWPFNVLIGRICAVLDDGVVAEEEREDLHRLMLDIIGCKDPVAERYEKLSCALPLTRPEPEVIFDQNQFVFTGRFVFGTRNRCFQETMLRGAEVADSVTLSTRYLVIGMNSSENWIHSSYGRKIEKAIELSPYGQIHIISEKRWQQFL